MNFLNPFALLGLAAAGIPVLLHLLNLRRLRTVDFSTLRFLRELQHTKVRRLKIQQILLLILRTLLVAFSVLALARPTMPGNLPLVGASSKASVVILLDNSGSMEAADPGGQRLRQAQDVAKRIVEGLRDGDEVAVIPMAGSSVYDVFEFTRTFDVARGLIDRVKLSQGSASLEGSLREAAALMADARHSHREVYVVSDAQANTTRRMVSDSGSVFDVDASVFLVRIGDGVRGLEQNLAVDSIHVATRIAQAQRPLEVEAVIVNTSQTDATGVSVSMAFDGVRVAQRIADVPAGARRSVSLVAPPPASGILAVSVELENDAIDNDNTRWAGVVIPKPPRVALVGPPLETMFVKTALSLPGMERTAPDVRTHITVGEALSSGADPEVIVVAGGKVSDADVARLQQFVANGGGALVFASEDPGLTKLMASFGLSVADLLQAPQDAPFRVTSTEKDHPLFAGVFRSSADKTTPVEVPRIWKMRTAQGGVDIVETSGGALVSEKAVGMGRVIYASVAPTVDWSTYPLTGLFAAFTIRSIVYTVMPRDGVVEADIGEPLRVQLPARFVGLSGVDVTDNSGVTTPTPVVQLPSGAIINVPPQDASGVVRIVAQEGSPVMAVTVNSANRESALTFLDNGAWQDRTTQLVSYPKRVAALEPNRSMRDVVESARTGTELWSVFVLLALACAVAEMLVSRFMVRDATPITA